MFLQNIHLIEYLYSFYYFPFGWLGWRLIKVSWSAKILWICLGPNRTLACISRTRHARDLRAGLRIRQRNRTLACISQITLKNEILIYISIVIFIHIYKFICNLFFKCLSTKWDNYYNSRGILVFSFLKMKWLFLHFSYNNIFRTKNCISIKYLWFQ